MSTPCFFILRQCPRPLLQFLSTANSIILPDAYESSYEKAKNCIWSIERHHYQWPWVTLNTEPTFVRSSYGPPGNTGLLCLCYTLPLQGSAVTFFRRRGQMHNHLCHISSGFYVLKLLKSHFWLRYSRNNMMGFWTQCINVINIIIIM